MSFSACLASIPTGICQEQTGRQGRFSRLRGRCMPGLSTPPDMTEEEEIPPFMLNFTASWQKMATAGLLLKWVTDLTITLLLHGRTMSARHPGWWRLHMEAITTRLKSLM